MKISGIILLLLVFLSFRPIGQNPPEPEIIEIGAKLSKLVEAPNTVKVYEEIQIRAIEGLLYGDIKWIFGDNTIEVDENYIVIFKIPGTYTLSIRGILQPHYKITAI
jgi:hypothetical protein